MADDNPDLKIECKENRAARQDAQKILSHYLKRALLHRLIDLCLRFPERFNLPKLFWLLFQKKTEG